MDVISKIFECIPCLDSENSHDHARCQTVCMETDDLLEELSEYFYFIYCEMNPTIEFHQVPLSYKNILIRMIKSEYSHKRNGHVWKIGIFGKVFLDLYLDEDIYRVSFKKELDGTFMTYISFHKHREMIPGGSHCSYCRKGVDELEKNMKICGSCRQREYCGTQCQSMDWLAEHARYCLYEY